MVINAGELDLDGALWAILGLAGYTLMVPVAVALVAARLGGRRFGIRSVAVGLVIAIAVLVAVVVLLRTLGGEATVWDVLWTVSLTAVAVVGARGLRPDARRSTDPA